LASSSSFAYYFSYKTPTFQTLATFHLQESALDQETWQNLSRDMRPHNIFIFRWKISLFDKIVVALMSVFLVAQTTEAFSPIDLRSEAPINQDMQRSLALYKDTNFEDMRTSTSPWTLQQLDDYADSVNVTLSWSTLGPGFRVVARAAHNESLILGYVEGFVRPLGQILHLDKMEVFQPMVKKARRELPDNALNFGGVSFGLGLVMGYRCLLHGHLQGCSVAEFLAIDDEAFQHKRLVRYYQRAGFQIVKYVGDDFKDIPDRMVWGGCGTLMREDMDVLSYKWTQLLALMKSKAAH
jgi:hypothetical protein